MRLGLLLLLLGSALLAFGLIRSSSFWLLAWFGADFIAVGCALLARWPRVFGKRPDGTLPWWSRLLFAPFLLYTRFVWRLLRLVYPEPPFNQVTDQLVVARRLLPHEVEGHFANYIDLTAEFSEPKALRTLPGYFSFPILDASAPTPEALHQALSQLRPGRTLIHCAQGHGRTGLFALAYLLKTGQAQTIEAGLAMLKKARPGIRLNSTQRRCLETWEQSREHRL